MSRLKSIQRGLLLLLVCILIPASLSSYWASALADRSLYVVLDKPLYVLGETVTMTIMVRAEGCKHHAHFLDIYIYNSENILVREIYVEKFQDIPIPSDELPVNVTYVPLKVDVYTVKLFVKHVIGPGGGSTYLEDTVTFRVIPHVVMTQTTTLPTTASLVTITRTVVTTTTTSATVSITTEEREMVKVDWVAILILLTAVAAALSIFAAFEIGKRKGKESRELHRLPFPPKSSAKCLCL